MNKYILLICFTVFLFAGSCVSMVEKAGRALDGSAKEEKRLTVYRAEKKEGAAADMELREVQNKAGNRSIVILLEAFPSVKFRCSFPNENGEFYFTSLEYLAGSFHGWNEYSMDLLGVGSLTYGSAFIENTAILAVPEKIEMVQISSGRIKRYDTRITGNEALGKLRDRQERINALAEWMGQQEDAPQGLNRKEFEQYWKPKLFPEITAKKKQPQDWKHPDDKWEKEEDVRWNVSYTGRVFPEILREIRNTGTMLRDWEEALPWIYVVYEWENILKLLAQDIVLLKKK